MAFCGNCGAVLGAEAAFCGSCGRQVAAAAQVSPMPASAPLAGPGTAAVSGLTPNLAGALTYALGIITGVLFLVLEPYRNDRFVRFHAMQSILFTAACVAFSISWIIVWGILFSISGYLALVAVPLRLLISLGIFAFWLFLMYQAYNQREYRIPYIGALAARQVE